MATKSPSQFHNSWGSVVDATELPNVAGAVIQDAALEAGDVCFSTLQESLYQCVDPTLGAAVSRHFEPNYIEFRITYLYTEMALPTIDTLGIRIFDASRFSTPSGAQGVVFRARLMAVFAAAATADVNLYDRGVPGAPAAPILVAQLSTGVSGAIEDLAVTIPVVAPLGAPPPPPGLGEIVSGPRIYEAAVTEGGVPTPGDTIQIYGVELAFE